MTAPITVYHAIGGSLQRLGRGTNVTVPPTRPTGTGYVAWETLWAAGDDLRSVLAKVRNGDVLTLPAGTYEFRDFNDGGTNYGVSIPAACGGLWGSGTGLDGNPATIFQMTPNTSTKASSVPTAAGTTNPLFLMRSGSDGTIFKKFQLKGTQQGHLYNGLRLSGTSANPITGTVDGVYCNGCNPGNASVNPGETFAFSTNHTDGVQILNSFFDGRDVGAGYCSTLIGHNSSTNTYLQDTTVQYAWYGAGITHWQTTNIHSVRLVSQYNGWGGTGGHAINHENTGGTILHESPTLIIDLAHAHGKHFTINTATDSGYPNNPNISLTNVTHDAGPSTYNGALYFQIGDTFLGSPNPQTSMPAVTKNGVSLVALDSSVGGTANPARNMVRAH